jgi:hypothetical protein
MPVPQDQTYWNATANETDFPVLRGNITVDVAMLAEASSAQRLRGF